MTKGLLSGMIPTGVGFVGRIVTGFVGAGRNGFGAVTGFVIGVAGIGAVGRKGLSSSCSLTEFKRRWEVG